MRSVVSAPTDQKRGSTPHTMGTILAAAAQSTTPARTLTPATDACRDLLVQWTRPPTATTAVKS